MALTEADKLEVMEMMRVVLAETQHVGIADRLLGDILRQPTGSFYAGPARSRYTQVTLCDESGEPVYQLRVATADLRSLLTTSIQREPGRSVPKGQKPEPIVGPKERA